MRTAFSLLDSAIYAVNAQMENGDSLDSVRVKAVFLALCFGEDAPTARAANCFVDCFYTWVEATRIVEVEDENGEITEEEESYAVAKPLSTSTAYSRVAALLGREITNEDKDNIAHIYRMIVGDMGDLRYNGWYSYIGGPFDPEWYLPAAATDPIKTAEGLVAYVTNAYEIGWGYVWGTFGNVLTEGAFASKLEQYPEAVGNYADFIRANWIGRRTADCVGLIKSYGWFDPDTGNIVYGSHGMPDVGADQMYYAAAESGTNKKVIPIPPYIPFTPEQKEQAAATDLQAFLLSRGEKLIRSGREKRLASDHSVTIRGGEWYDHAEQQGGNAISFLQRYYNMSFPDAVQALLGGDFKPVERKPPEPKPFVLPEAHSDMRMVFAYLTKTRGIDSRIAGAFAHDKLLYEDAKYHNAVFVGRHDKISSTI